MVALLSRPEGPGVVHDTGRAAHNHNRAA